VSIPSNSSVAPKRSRSFRLDLSPRSWRNGLIFILLIVGCDAIGTLTALLLPAVQAAREAARRITCSQNLKQIGVAMQSYHQKYGCFPPSFIPDENGKPKHSWRVLLLPFLDKQDLHAQYRFDEPWDSPNNLALDRQMPAVYRCPSDPASSPSQTSYAMIVGPHAISDGPTARRMSDIKDSPANTIMMVEAAKAGINWMEPRDLSAEKLNLCTRAVEKDLRRETCEIFCNHDPVANVLLCDGSVRTLASESVTPEELKALMTIDGGGPVQVGR
jgi:prepilin-type processing-associated H-X9-DG protein